MGTGGVLEVYYLVNLYVLWKVNSHFILNNVIF